MNTSSNLQLTKLVWYDLAILSVIYFVPTLSHLFSFPLYLMEPMRLAVLGSYLFLRNRNNSYIMALTLPLFSYIVAGHPIAVKNAIIAIELVTNVFILDLILKRSNKVFLTTFSSILLSKLLYYVLKGLTLYSGLLSTIFIDTSIWIQLITSIAISVLFSVVYTKKR